MPIAAPQWPFSRLSSLRAIGKLRVLAVAGPERWPKHAPKRLGSSQIEEARHRLATELGRELGVPMRLADLAHAELTEALNRG